jgi:membrane-bound lytic murein transglycosylase B
MSHLCRTLLAVIMLTCLFLRPAFADTHFAERKDVQQFIEMMVKKHKFDKAELTTLFNKVELRPQIMHHFNQPYEEKPWHLYQMLFVSEWRIKHGVEFWNKYAKDLARAEEVFKVPASIIVATIGVETKYGQKTGEYRVLDSLSNLGFSDSKRAPYFRYELEQFLLLTREQKTDPLKMLGSYAGAIGQPQFMPSSYRHYAVNFSNSGTTDLMNDEVDIIGSVANYYSKHGWKIKQPVAVEAKTIGNRYKLLVDIEKPKTTYSVTQLAKFGMVPKEKDNDVSDKVKVLELENRYSKEYWLTYHNFDVIKRYNTNSLYAMAVYQLSSYIEALRNRLNHA